MLLEQAGLEDVCQWEGDADDCSRHPVTLNLKARKPHHCVPVQYPDFSDMHLVQTCPRLGFSDHMYCTAIATKQLCINLTRHTGVFWTQGIDRVLSDAMNRPGIKWIVTTDYDTVWESRDLIQMRDIAERFNARFGDGEEILTVPSHRIPEVGARIMDLQHPENKMSTTGGSEEGTVYVLDDPEAIRKKLARAVTDSGTEIVRAPDKPGVTNLIDILAASREVDPAQVEEEMAQARGYGDLKGAVADAVVEMLEPVQQRYGALRGDEQALEEVLAAGAARAREIAAPTVADVRRVMGVGPPPGR